MKALLRSGLCLALGLAPTWSAAQDVQWRAAAPPTRGPAAGVQQVSAHAPIPDSTGIRAVSLSRPVPLDAAGPGPVVRGQNVDDRPLPPGPPLPVLQGTEPRMPIPRPIAAVQEKAPAKGGDFTAPAPQLLHPPTGPAISPAPAITTTPTVPPPTNVWGGTTAVMSPDLLGLGDGGCGPDGCGGPGGLLGGGPLDGCGVGDGCCLSRGRGWAGAEYLFWYTKAMSVPPLVTASPRGTRFEASGVLPGPTTVLLDSIENEPRSGARFYGGYWFSDCGRWGVDASVWFLGDRGTSDVFGSAGDPQISRPFFDAFNNRPAAEIVSFIGPTPDGNAQFNSTGFVTVESYSRLWSGDINLRRKLWCGPNYFVDGLIGYRHFRLSEGLSIREDLTALDPPLGTPARGFITVFDNFQTRNRFDGGQLGVTGEYRFLPRWSLFGSAKLGLGNMHQTVSVDGFTRFAGFAPQAVGQRPLNPPNGTFPGGLLASPTNIGTRSVDRFAAIPEVSLKVGYDVTERLRLYVGYDFVYASSVVRPGDQIDTVVNPAFLPPPAQVPIANPGPRRPMPLFNVSDYWAQGVNFGLQYRY